MSGASGRLRVGVLGARSVRQGIGPYVARAFARAGCRVAAIAGTSAASVEQARAGLEARFGLRVEGHVGLEALLERGGLDALAICSPAERHREALERARAAGLHVLCEKPLWWAGGAVETQEEARTAARAVAGGYAAAGLHLALNAQWPFTLDGFRRLHGAGAARGGVVRRFEMHLAPRTTGLARVADMAPHVLSMLIALAGPGRVRAESARCVAVAGGGGAETLELRFAWEAAGGEVETRARLLPLPSAGGGRLAGYAVDGRRAERVVRGPDYRMALVDGAREVALPDPLDACVASFVAAVERRAPPDVDALVANHVGVRDLVAVAAASGAAEGAR